MSPIPPNGEDPKPNLPLKIPDPPKAELTRIKRLQTFCTSLFLRIIHLIPSIILNSFLGYLFAKREEMMWETLFDLMWAIFHMLS